MNFEEMTNRQVTAAAKARNIVINYTWSNGGGPSDPNRDHRSWYIEIYTGWQTDKQEFVNEFVSDCMVSGKWDGKAACERAAKRIALIQVIRRQEGIEDE